MEQLETKERLIRLARQVIVDVNRNKCPLIAACVVSSVAVGDFTPASDVDILMISAKHASIHGVQRKLIEGVVFEWVIISKNELEDVEVILGDAGLTHDIVSAIILQDENHWLEEIQKKVISLYQEPARIWLRAQNQLGRMQRDIKRMSQQVEQEEILPAQRSHVSILKAVFGLPRAILNRRCTMTRALLFCRETIEELDWHGYLADALELFGVVNIDKAFAQDLHALSKKIVAISGFTPNEKTIRVRHLEGSQWLLNNAEPADAVWPLYFWSSTNVEENGGKDNTSVWRLWLEFANLLGLGNKDGLQRKAILAEKLLYLAIKLVNARKDSFEQER